MFVKADDLYARVRSALLMALMTSEKSLESKATSLVQSDHRYVKMLSDLIYRPLPDRYQNAIEFQGQQISASTLKHLKNCENQVRKSVIAILYKVAHDENSITWESDLLVAIPVLVKAARDPDDIGLRIGAVGCLRFIARQGNIYLSYLLTYFNFNFLFYIYYSFLNYDKMVICRYEAIRRSMSENIIKYWKNLMPISKDIEVIEAIEVLAIYNDLAETLINDIYFFHRLPYLMNARDKSLRIIAYQSLYPFSTSTQYKWKIIQSGLLHMIIQGLYDGHRSIYMSALLCLSHLCTSNEAFLAVKAEMSRQKPLPACIGESLIFVVMSFPKQEMCSGSLKLLGEVLPKLKYLPQNIFTQLSASLHLKGDLSKKTKVAKLVSTIAKVEKFRSKFLKSKMVSDLLCQVRNGTEPCKAAIYQALAELSVNNKTVSKKLSDVKGFTESLWIAQSSLNDELAIAALELLRVISESLCCEHHYTHDDSILVELPLFKSQDILSSSSSS